MLRPAPASGGPLGDAGLPSGRRESLTAPLAPAEVDPAISTDERNIWQWLFTLPGRMRCADGGSTDGGEDL